MLVPDRTVPGAFFVRIDGTDQSFVDPSDPLRLEFDYVQRIAEVIDTIAPAGERIRVLHVGGAGMTLPRYVAATRPTSAQIVFEPDTALTEQIRAILPLPKRSGIKVRPVDGRAGLAEVPDDHADLVVVDAFAGARVPAELTTAEWYAEVARVLAPDGVIVVNITDRVPFLYAEVARVLSPGGVIVVNITDRVPFLYAKRVVAGIADRFQPVVCALEPATLKGHRFGNIVIAAGRPVQHATLERLANRGPFPYRVLGGLHLARWVGKFGAFTDEDAEQSPAPLGGPTTFR